MKKYSKIGAYIAGVMVLSVLLVLLVSLKERNEATKQAKDYLEKNYPMMTYEIQEVSSATKLSHYSRHHGYFKYAINVQNMDTKETFQVFYDKKIKRLEDAIHIERQETYLKDEITPKVEHYVAKHFGATRYIDVYYDMEDGEPMVVVTFEGHHKDMTQAEFDAFLVFLKETVGLKNGTVIVDYWLREVAFKTEL